MRADEALMGRDMFGEIVKPDIKGILKNKFLIPPFSVLSARDGDWQNRKRQWLQLGIKSEVGRDEAVTYQIGDKSTWQQGIDEKNNKRELVAGERDISAKRWGKSHNSLANVTERYETGQTVTETVARIAAVGTGTSIFDPVLCELMYSWFCKEGGQILDPFCGGSVRGIVASVMGYKYWGCDLRQEQIDANYAQVGLCGDNKPDWITGDALEAVKDAPQSDFIFTCPPYGDLEVYSDDPKDISTMDFPKFITTLTEIIKLSCDKLRNNSFACIVVGDYRDKQGFYRCFPQHTIKAFLDAGLKLYNEIILVTAVGSLPIRITKQFEAGRKIGKTHQNVLVFCKGTPPRFNKEDEDW